MAARRDYASRRLTTPLPPALLAAVAAVPTGDLSDLLAQIAAEPRGIDGLAPLHARPAPRLLGRAVTIAFAEVGPGRSLEDAPYISSTVVAEAEPGDVIVLAAGAARRAFFGEHMARMAAAAGVAGIVVDGGIRDVDGIAATGLPLFSRPPTPVAYLGSYEAVAVNEPVVVAGVTVEPGDLIAGDSDGLVAIPRASFGVIELLTAELVRIEAWIESEVAAGASPEDFYPEIERRLRAVAARAR